MDIKEKAYDPEVSMEDYMLDMIKIYPEFYKGANDGTEGTALKALSVNAEVLEHIDNPTETMYLQAIQTDPMILKNIALEDQALELCIIAVLLSEDTLEHVLDKSTRDLCKQILSNESNNVDSLIGGYRKRITTI